MQKGRSLPWLGDVGLEEAVMVSAHIREDWVRPLEVSWHLLFDLDSSCALFKVGFGVTKLVELPEGGDGLSCADRFELCKH